MRKRVVVVGGGYAGVRGALRARRRLGSAADVVLVAATDRFVERVRLHEEVASARSVSHPLAERLAGSGVELVIGRALGIDVSRGALAVAGRAPLGFDALLLAVGSVVDRARIPGADAHAWTLDDGAAGALAARVRALAPGAVVTLVGGGLTGVEAAAEIAEARPDLHVRLVAKRLLGAEMAADSVRYAARALARLGVEVRLGAAASAIEPGAVQVGTASLASSLTLVAPGFCAPPLARASSLPVDAAGRVMVDASLRVAGAACVFAAGDAARVTFGDGREAPLGCKSALPMAAHAADAIARELRGGASPSFAYRPTLFCVSLGRRDGVLQAVRADGRATWLAVRGVWAAQVKEWIVRSTMSLLEAERARAARATPPRPLAVAVTP